MNKRTLAIWLIVVVLLGLAGVPAEGGAPPPPEEDRWILVGPADNPVLLDREDPNFWNHYLVFCSAREYEAFTGHKYVPPEVSLKEYTLPKLTSQDLQKSEAFGERLRAECVAKFGTEDPPDEVRRELSFPPAGRQLKEDCGAWALAYGGTRCERDQFAGVWANPYWEPKWIVSPRWFSSLTGPQPNCLTPGGAGRYIYMTRGALTLDRLPYGDGDCSRFKPNDENFALAYPLKTVSYEDVFIRDTSGGLYIELGEPEDLMRAIALGYNITGGFESQDGEWGHQIAIGGYKKDYGVHCINSWGSDWGPEGNGWFWITWKQLLGDEPMGIFFDPRKKIYDAFFASKDWDGECTLPDADYRGICPEVTPTPTATSTPTTTPTPTATPTPIKYEIYLPFVLKSWTQGGL